MNPLLDDIVLLIYEGFEVKFSQMAEQQHMLAVKILFYASEHKTNFTVCKLVDLRSVKIRDLELHVISNLKLAKEQMKKSIETLKPTNS